MLAVRGGLPAPRGAGAIAFGLLAALTAWVGSDDVVVDRAGPLLGGVRPPARLRSVALLGLVATRAPRPARTAAAGLALLLGLVLAWALLGKVIPSLFPDGARVARLRNPVGYWNSLALVAATAVPFGLWAACSRRSTPWRAPPERSSSTSPSSSSSSPTRVRESPLPVWLRSPGW